MSTWYTADLHLGHENIIKYCNRPFASVGAMNAAIVQRWNELVAPHDIVWVLGDVALSTRALAPVADLNGYLILVAGNHDSCWAGHKRWARAVHTYAQAGFSQIFPAGVLKNCRVAGDDGPLVDLAHLPYTGDSHTRDRYQHHRPVDEGRPLLCGHVHDAWKTNGRQINVGVDVWDYRPVHQDTVRALIEELP